MANFLTGFLGLGTGGPGAFTELTGTGYARQAVTFGPIVGATTTLLGGVTFAATGTWPTATQHALYDASGNLLMWWNVKAPATLASGQTVSFDLGAMGLTFPAIFSGPTVASVIFAPGAAIGATRGGATIFAGVAIQIAAGQVGVM